MEAAGPGAGGSKIIQHLKGTGRLDQVEALLDLVDATAGLAPRNPSHAAGERPVGEPA